MIELYSTKSEHHYMTWTTYRICLTIGKISVDFVLNILLRSDLTLALEIIHRLKRVHRDVSTGNILLYQGVGRLSDLEFLKEVSSLQSHEVKTVCLHASLWQAVPSNTTA